LYKILANSLFLGKKVIYMPSCHSTNDIAKEMARKSDISEGTVIITDDQLKGRGQRGNEWVTAAGKNITMSIVLKPNFVKASSQFFLNMAISLAVNATVKQLLGDINCSVKWPNDVLVNRKKISGILIENSLSGRNLDYSVVGIGLNVNQSIFNGISATSLKNELKCELQLLDVFQRLVENIEAFYLRLKAGRLSGIKEEYLSSLYGYKTKLKYRSEFEFEGIIEDVADSGLLSVSVDGKLRVFDFKEIEFIL